MQRKEHGSAMLLPRLRLSGYQRAMCRLRSSFPETMKSTINEVARQHLMYNPGFHIEGIQLSPVSQNFALNMSPAADPTTDHTHRFVESPSSIFSIENEM